MIQRNGIACHTDATRKLCLLVRRSKKRAVVQMSVAITRRISRLVTISVLLNLDQRPSSVSARAEQKRSLLVARETPVSEFTYVLLLHLPPSRIVRFVSRDKNINTDYVCRLAAATCDVRRRDLPFSTAQEVAIFAVVAQGHPRKQERPCDAEMMLCDCP